jgi:hypothetical protein
LSGTATSYAKTGRWDLDGTWAVTPAATAPYTVRILVRRPSDASRFNGIVVVEWLNVTAQAEGAADYMQMQEEIVREGYAWVGIGAQAVGVNAPATGLKAWDGVRLRRSCIRVTRIRMTSSLRRRARSGNPVPRIRWAD